ncbi:glucose/galactose MFS transporter [Lacimicrobium alkaliphilum]|uniref:Glucose/galactose MFS transporter n=2 Tax=Lacimicrobium alkaliphilum TaxID=1526571 RepID=A0ABQ1RLA2_9ALTE|nr:glucose/galactose MFS transporter [Lacimicrobium alkaliphilum]
MWGFITALNDILIPHLKSVFSLSYTQAMLVQFCFFMAYFLVSVPAGRIVDKIGFQKGIGLGLLTAAAGCLLFIPSALYTTYWMFLGALFILAAGVTILQVAANPLVTLLGDPDTAESRLTMTQAFNSLGTTVAPVIGGILIFSHAEGSVQSADSVIVPYIGLALVLIGLAAFLVRMRLPETGNHVPSAADLLDSKAKAPLKNYPHLILGALGIFLYVGAEVSIGSFLVNYLGEDSVMGMSEGQASKYIAYYWGGAMVGRFIGAILMQKITPGKLLGFNSAASIALLLVSIFSSGQLAMWSVLLVGLCNSIMFPTIFSLALKGLGKDTSRGSGLLCLAIVGGAIVPLLQGILADSIGLQLSFLLPMLCYLYIGFYGLAGAAIRARKANETIQEGI